MTPAATVLDFTTPSTVDSGDNGSVTLGMKFQTDFSGSATGVRFYKATANTGTHVGALWTAGGTLLAQATFTNETATGWQHVLFSSPVTLTADTTYVVSYLAPNGNYSVTGGGFASAIDNPPLHGLSNATSANGVFAYGGSSTFPTSSWNAGNYAVDVMFQPAAAPGTPTGVSATAGSAAANVSWTAPSTGGPPTSYKITPYIGATAQTTTTVTGSPPATSKTITGLTPGTSYTFTVRASNPGGSGPESAASGAVVPTGAAAPGAPTSATAEADSTSALVNWTAPSDEGGSDDHRLHGHAVHRRGRAELDRRGRLRHQGAHHRAHERDELHVQDQGDQLRRERPGLRRVQRRRAEALAVRARDAGCHRRR